MAETKLSRDAQRTKHEGAIEKQIIADNDEIFGLFADSICGGGERKYIMSWEIKLCKQMNLPFYTRFVAERNQSINLNKNKRAIYFALCDCEVMKCEWMTEICLMNKKETLFNSPVPTAHIHKLWN